MSALTDLAARLHCPVAPCDLAGEDDDRALWWAPSPDGFTLIEAPTEAAARWALAEARAERGLGAPPDGPEPVWYSSELVWLGHDAATHEACAVLDRHVGFVGRELVALDPARWVRP